MHHHQCVDVRRPTPLSHKIKSHVTPWACLSSHFAFKPLLKTPSLFSPLLLFSSPPCPPPPRCLLRSLSRKGETKRCKDRKAVLPTRSAEVWPLSVPALSQLSHGACSPDCVVSHRVVRLCCLTALCMHFPQFPFSREFSFGERLCHQY